MEGHRRHAEEPEPSWYTGQRSPEGQSPYAAPAQGADAYDPSVQERPGAFRLPGQRAADPYSASPVGYAVPDPVTTSGSHALSSADSGSIRVPVRGPEYPAVRPGGATSPAPAPAPATVTSTTTYGSAPEPAPAASYNEPTSMVAMAGGRFGAESSARGEAPDAVYRSRRPVSAVVFAAVTVVLLIPAMLLLIRATFVDDVSARGVVPAVLLTLGLALTGFGLYSLATGGPASARDVWLRPPLAYLPIGLVLLLAAGLAVA